MKLGSVRKKGSLIFPLDHGPVSGCSLLTVPVGVTGLRRGDYVIEHSVNT